jgi:hypothetical protein
VTEVLEQETDRAICRWAEQAASPEATAARSVGRFK